jgi:hypothetical protein
MLESLLYLKQFTEKQLLKLHNKRCNENCFRVVPTSPTQNEPWACTIGGGILDNFLEPLLLMVL